MPLLPHLRRACLSASFLLGALAMSTRSLAETPTLSTATLLQASDWGFLRQVAGRDLELCRKHGCDMAVVARWIAPESELVFESPSFGKTHYYMDGKRLFWGKAGGRSVPVYQLPDGGLRYTVYGFTVVLHMTGGQLTFEYFKAKNNVLVPVDAQVQFRMPEGTGQRYANQLAQLVKKYPPATVIGPIAAKPDAGKTAFSTSENTFFYRPTVGAPQASQFAATIPRGPRFALVIGNGEYANTMGALKNPPNDARMVAAELKASGFQVELVIDADQRAMKQAISRLGERMASGGRGSTGLFYFAGHGMQSRGINYLIPTGAAIKREADVDLEAVSADTVLLQMEEADAGTNIMILDACRNTPVLRSFRSGTRGLAQMEAPNGSFISYSTAPGSVAADGAGDFSPFASALAQQLRNKGQPIEITFRNVRREVLKLTEGQQTPWDSSSLVETFMFNPG